MKQHSVDAPGRFDYPPVEARPETVEFGKGAVRYLDPFRWLEEDADQDVLAWQGAQDEFAQSHLVSLSSYNAFPETLHEMGDAEDILLPAFAGGHYVRRFVPEGQDLTVVELSGSPTGTGRRVVDLNALRAGEPLQMARYALSHDGKMAVFAHTAGGREKPIVQLVEVETGKVLSQGRPPDGLFDGTSAGRPRHHVAAQSLAVTGTGTSPESGRTWVVDRQFIEQVVAFGGDPPVNPTIGQNVLAAQGAAAGQVAQRHRGEFLGGHVGHPAGKPATTGKAAIGTMLEGAVDAL